MAKTYEVTTDKDGKEIDGFFIPRKNIPAVDTEDSRDTDRRIARAGLPVGIYGKYRPNSLYSERISIETLYFN